MAGDEISSFFVPAARSDVGQCLQRYFKGQVERENINFPWFISFNREADMNVRAFDSN